MEKSKLNKEENQLIISKNSIINEKINNNNEEDNLDLILNEYKCPECSSIPEIINIDYENNNIEIQCPFHIKKIKLHNFINEIIKYNYNFSICNFCNKTMPKNISKLFQYCYNCNKKICPNCFNTHDLTHKIIYINELNNKCKKHFNELYTSFCLKCQQNICNECKKSKLHINHIKFDFAEIQPTKEELEQIVEFNNKIKNNLKIFENNDKKEINQINNYKKKRLNIIEFIYNNQNEKIINDINKRINEQNNTYVKKLENLYLKYLDDSSKIIKEYNEWKESIEKEREASLSACKSNYLKAKNLTEEKYNTLVLKCQVYNERLRLKYNNIISLNDIIINSYNKNKNQYYYIINVINNINFIKKYNEEKVKAYLKEINDMYEINISEKNIVIEKNIITSEGLKNILSQLNIEKIENLYINSSNISNLRFINNYNYTQLKSLSIINCNINLIDNLKLLQCPQLTKLDLSYNKICNINGLNNTYFNSLEIINLKKNNIYELEVFGKDIWSNLKEINLSYNNIVDIKVFNNAKCTKLKTLILSYNKIKDKDVIDKNHLKELEILELDNQS